MIGVRVATSATLSHFSPGQPFVCPSTDAGNLLASERQFSQVPTSM
jgi:hypothetical protein